MEGSCTCCGRGCKVNGTGVLRRGWERWRQDMSMSAHGLYRRQHSGPLEDQDSWIRNEEVISSNLTGGTLETEDCHACRPFYHSRLRTGPKI